MKKQIAHRQAIVLVVLLITTNAALPARAQMARSAADAPLTWDVLIAQEDWMHNLSDGAVPAGFGVDLEALTSEEWKVLRSELVATLRSSKDEAWEDAVLQVIHLATRYRDRVRLRGASLPLLESYILDRNERHRVMALAAMHAIGHHGTMARLSQRVQTESSPRVRRLTAAAVIDYFSPNIEVGMPKPARGK